MLFPVDDLLFKDNLESTMFLTVLQFNFRINAYWCMLQTIMDRTVDVVFCNGVILDVRDCAAQWHQCLSTTAAPVSSVIHPICYILFCFCCFLKILR